MKNLNEFFFRLAYSWLVNKIWISFDKNVCTLKALIKSIIYKNKTKISVLVNYIIFTVYSFQVNEQF